MEDNILVMKDITKEFPGVKALNDVNLEVRRGEIHALVGENGAGKSTLMNVLSGTFPHGSYTGEIIYNGEECNFKTVRDSEKIGIVIIHQELALIPELSIGENIFLGNERRGRFGINWDETFAQAQKHMTQAVLEGVAFGMRDSLEVARSLGIDIPRSKLCGGGAKSPLWRAIFADVLNLELDTVETEEGPGYGGAILAAVACGEYPSVEAAADALVRVTATQRPDPGAAARYEAQYRKYRRIYPALRAVFPALL